MIITRQVERISQGFTVDPLGFVVIVIALVVVAIIVVWIIARPG